MDYALAARSNAEQDVVELAERIHDFLAPRQINVEMLPPPIPELVQQVRHDADLSQADQSPPKAGPRISPEEKQADVFRRSFFAGDVGHASDCADDDTKTRIVSRSIICRT